MIFQLAFAAVGMTCLAIVLVEFIVVPGWAERIRVKVQKDKYNKKD